MGREFASAAARWCHLVQPGTTKPLNYIPVITHVCDVQMSMMQWFIDNFPTLKATTNYKELLENKDIDAIYCAVPHNLHENLYIDIINAGKHLLGEKPFGIDLAANTRIMAALKAHPEVFVRCSSEFPFYPGAHQIAKYIRDKKFGKIIEVEAGFWHSSDLDPNKAINWKRIVATNGEYGCLGDLGMHVVHVPLRFGWIPTNVRALFTKVVPERPGEGGKLVACETWDNATLLCDVEADGQRFPMTLSTKRISPGDMDTWFIRVIGTDFSAEYSTKFPRTVRTLPYSAGGPQAWHCTDVGYTAPYAAITGGIFEFGFPDAMLQMWAAFCDEMINGRDKMGQFFHCATPEEAMLSHRLFTAALQSFKTAQVVAVK